MVSGVASGSTPSSYDVAPTTTWRGTTVMSRSFTTSGGSMAVLSVTSATRRDMRRRLPGHNPLMRIVIAGGHGQIALHLERRLAERGHEAVGIVRNPDHVGDLETIGARAVVLDLEQSTVDDVAQAVHGADAVVFAAGAGPNSGAARKETVDKGAAILLADAAEQAGVRRYLMVSAMGTENA